MLIPRIKVLVLLAAGLFLQSQAIGAGSFWLQFGQIAAITYIAWLVIKRGSKAGDQDITFWINYHNSHYDKIEQLINRRNDERQFRGEAGTGPSGPSRQDQTDGSATGG